MRSIEALQTLVVSLSKSEKRYFKLFCDRQEGDKAYWRLHPFAAWAAAKGQKVPFAQWLRQKAASGEALI